MILLPGKRQMKFLDEVIYLTDIVDALESGANVFRYTAGWLHGKVMMQDNKKAIIGSCNLDYFSVNRNWESGLLMEGKSAVDDVRRQIFAGDEPPNSRQLELKKIPWKKRFVCKLADRLPWL